MRNRLYMIWSFRKDELDKSGVRRYSWINKFDRVYFVFVSRVFD